MPIQLDSDKPLFSIGVAADLVGLNRATLRAYEKAGLLNLHRDGTAKRLYSLNDLERLHYLFYLTKIRRIGIAGSRYMLEILDRVCEKDRMALLAEAEDAVTGLTEKARALLEQESVDEQPANHSSEDDGAGPTTGD